MSYTIYYWKYGPINRIDAAQIIRRVLLYGTSYEQGGYYVSKIYSDC